MKIGVAPEWASPGAFAELTNPGPDFVIIFGVGRCRAIRANHAWRSHVAMILDVKSELIEDAADARGPERRRPHQRAGLRGADLDGDTEQGDARSC